MMMLGVEVHGRCGVAGSGRGFVGRVGWWGDGVRPGNVGPRSRACVDAGSAGRRCEREGAERVRERGRGR